MSQWPIPPELFHPDVSPRLAELEAFIGPQALKHAVQTGSSTGITFILHNGALSLAGNIPDAPKTPLSIDFTHGPLAYKARSGAFRNAALAKAISITRKPGMQIIDATAGLGSDSFMLGSLGAQLVMIERNPIIAALLADALWRAEQHAAIRAVTRRMRLMVGDAVNLLPTITPPPEAVYLDPMFPGSSKTALPKAGMQYLRHIINEPVNEKILLKTSQAVALNHVVVKRPRLAPSLGGISPTESREGESCRFDIYRKSGRSDFHYTD